MSEPFAGVVCPECGPQDLTFEQYDVQMDNPNALWKCPKCREVAEFDDERFEELNP